MLTLTRHEGATSWKVRSRQDTAEALADPETAAALKRGDRVNVLLTGTEGTSCIVSMHRLGRDIVVRRGASLAKLPDIRSALARAGAAFECLDVIVRG